MNSFRISSASDRDRGHRHGAARVDRYRADARQRPHHGQGRRRTGAAGRGRRRQGADDRTDRSHLRQERQEGRVAGQRRRQRRAGRSRSPRPASRPSRRWSRSRGTRRRALNVTLKKEPPRSIRRPTSTRSCRTPPSSRRRANSPRRGKIYEDLLAKYPQVYQLEGFIARIYAAENDYPKALRAPENQSREGSEQRRPEDVPGRAADAERRQGWREGDPRHDRHDAGEGSVSPSSTRRSSSSTTSKGRKRSIC